MSIAHQITYCAWLAIVFHVMDSLLADHESWSSVISWLQVTLECACKFHVISCLKVIFPLHFLLLWISYWMSRAQLCHCPLIVPHCLASTVCRSEVDSWNRWRMALLLRLQWWEGAFTHYHIFCGWSFFLLLWISYQMSGAQLCHHRLIVPGCSASTVCRSAVDSWNHWRMALLLQLQWWEGAFTHYHIFCGWSFFLLLWISYQMSGAQLCHHQLIVPCCSASTVCRSALDSRNRWRMALLSWLRWWEGAFTFYHIICSWSLVVSDSLAHCKNYDSNAWVLFQVQVSTFSSISGWLHD
jgi:hypothetical protein